MPELPEVETTRRGIEPYLLNQQIKRVMVRQRSLRWPIPRQINSQLSGKKFLEVRRRGKYLLLKTEANTALIHLGMSGRLSVVPANKPAGKHDHVDFVLQSGLSLRLNDPRRFGCILLTKDPLSHPLLSSLGPEPLEHTFDGKYLHGLCSKRKVAIKSLIMNSKVVVGVGNIYANEALFMAGIHPERPANQLQQKDSKRLVVEIKRVLKKAIRSGGTTLQDFLDPEGKPGYFAQSLMVYGRGDKPCMRCGNQLQETRLGQRSTVYCTQCQI